MNKKAPDQRCCACSRVFVDREFVYSIALEQNYLKEDTISGVEFYKMVSQMKDIYCRPCFFHVAGEEYCFEAPHLPDWKPLEL